jgi:hypothetical protein
MGIDKHDDFVFMVRYISKSSEDQVPRIINYRVFKTQIQADACQARLEMENEIYVAWVDAYLVE